MCGIVGLLVPGGYVNTDTISSMRDALRHPGPDDEGLWISYDNKGGW